MQLYSSNLENCLYEGVSIMGYDYDYKQKLLARRARVTDGSGNVGLGLQRPGFRIVDSTSSDAKERAYQEYENELVNAWRQGASARAELHRIVSKSSQGSAHDHATIDQFYAAYDKELANAWRKS
jgi:hypothetical protein